MDSRFDFARLLRPDTAEGQTALLVLADVASLSDDAVTSIHRWTEAGRAVLIFAGSRLDPTWAASRQLTKDGLLPATPTGIANAPASPAAAPHDHAALSLWNQPGGGTLGDFVFDRHWQLTPDAGAETVLATVAGEPLIVQKRLGNGVVTLVAAPADGSWSNLPMRAGFLPLVQQLALHSIGLSKAPTTLTQDAPISFNATAASTLSFTTPAGTTSPLATSPGDDGQPIARITDTAEPGFYRVNDTAGDLAAVFAVNASRAEADVTEFNGDELQALAQQTGATVATSAEQFLTQDQTRRTGQELWRPVVFILLALLAGELLLSGRFALARPAASKGAA